MQSACGAVHNALSAMDACGVVEAFIEFRAYGGMCAPADKLYSRYTKDFITVAYAPSAEDAFIRFPDDGRAAVIYLLFLLASKEATVMHVHLFGKVLQFTIAITDAV